MLTPPPDTSPEAERQAAFVAEVNRGIAPRGTVRPHAILPAALWQGAYGTFLRRTLGHTPQQPWNTMLLPADPASADALRLPMAPADYPAGFYAAAETWIATVCERVMDAQRSASAGETVAFHAVLKAASDDLFAFAHANAVKQFGEADYQAHLLLFGDVLRWEHRARFLKASVTLPHPPRDSDHTVAARFSGPAQGSWQNQTLNVSAERMDPLTAAHRQRERLVEAVNQRLAPNAAIAAYDILPASLWEDGAGAFLTGPMNVYPAGRANTLLLPADTASAAALGLPMHPGEANEAVLRLAQREIRRAQVQLDQGLREEAALRFGFQAFMREQAVAAIGEAAWLRHAGLFGSVLDPDAGAATAAARPR
jgi:hypothetical protein